MEHIALYRKWRPQNFSDLVGQEHISKTLINAIKYNRLSHAYLFCGPRGTGKTTSARILARTLNCDSRSSSFSPCEQCPSCQDIMSGSALDIIEIDAASHRGIDEIRNLIDQVQFASVSGKYKVYIIDEFHMLTKEAFNAILKTLEEPPEKVVFVLATTEPHKVLPTIISRCQRFDFQRIPNELLVNRLRFISNEEKINISDESLLSIARKANGGLRDALSLLDQLSSFSIGEKNEISTELVYQVLGMVSADFLAKLIEKIFENEPAAIIKILNDLLKLGNDPVVIISETINYLRDLLIVKSSPDMALLLDVSSTNLDLLQKQADLFSKDELIDSLDFLNEAIERLKRTNQAQLWLEVNFIQLCKKINNKIILPKKAQELTTPLNVNGEQNKIISFDKKKENIELNDLRDKIAFLEKKLENLEKNGLVISPSLVKQKEEIKEENKLANELPKSTNYSNSLVNDSVDFDKIWLQILDKIRKTSIPTHAILECAVVEEIDLESGLLRVVAENEFYVKTIKVRIKNAENVLQEVFGRPMRMSVRQGNFSEIKKIFRPAKSEKKENVDLLENSDVISEPETFYQVSSPEIEENSEDSSLFASSVSIVDEKITDTTEPYILDNLDSESLSESSPENDENQPKNSKAYYEEVADIFKGKVINKNT